MLLPFFMWQMLLPLLCFLMADVIAIFCGRCYCHCFVFYWQMLLSCSCWLMLFPYFVCCLVDDRCCCHCGCCFCHLWGCCIILWQMLLPSCWLILLPCFCCCIVADVVATMADGITIYKTDVIGRCCLPGWQME